MKYKVIKDSIELDAGTIGYEESGNIVFLSNCACSKRDYGKRYVSYPKGYVIANLGKWFEEFKEDSKEDFELKLELEALFYNEFRCDSSKIKGYVEKVIEIVKQYK